MSEKQTAPQHQPAPQPVAAPVQQQPQPQFVPQQQVQYVVSQQSLEGVGGWLVFWLIVFIIMSIGYIMAFFTGLERGGEEASDVLLMIFSPLIAIGAIGSAVTIALRKKLAIWMSVATLGIAGLYNILSIVIAAVDNKYSSIAITVGGILVSIVFSGAIILYFFASKRVKQTLTR
jgi:hypothetical protein